MRPSSPVRFRRLRRGLAVGLAVVALTSLLTALNRRALAGWIFGKALRATGVELTHVVVEEVSLSRARLRDLDLGGGALTAARVVAWYRPLDLLRGQLLRTEVEDVAVRLGDQGSMRGGLAHLGLIAARDARLTLEAADGAVNLTINGSLRADPRGRIVTRLDFVWESALGRVTGDFDGEARSDGGLAGSIRIRDGRLHAGGGEVSGLTGDATVEWSAGLPDRFEARLSSREATLGGLRFIPIAALLRLDHGRLVVSADLHAPDGSADFALRGRADGLDRDPTSGAVAGVALDLDGEVRFPTTLTAWIGTAGIEAPSAGSTCVSVTIGGTVPLRTLVAGKAPGTVAAAREAAGGLVLDLAAVLHDVVLPGRARAIAGLLGVRGSLAGPTLRLQGSGRTSGILDPAWLSRLGLAEALPTGRIARSELQSSADAEVSLASDLGVTAVELLSLALTANLPGSGGRAGGTPAALAVLTLTGSGGGAPGTLAGMFQAGARVSAVELDAIHAEGIEIDVPLSGSLEAGRLRVGSAVPGEVRVAGFTAPDRVALAAPVKLQIDGWLAGVPDLRGRMAFRHRLSLAAAPVELRLGAGPAPTRATASFRSLAVIGEMPAGKSYRGRATLAGLDVLLPDLALALDGISAEVDGAAPPGGELGHFAVSRVRYLEETALFAPIELSGSLRRAGGEITLAGEASFPGSPGRWTLAGRLRPGDPSGELRVVSPVLAFVPGVLEPKRLAPRLAAMSAVRGQARVEVRATWSGGRPEGVGRVQLEDVSFEAADLVVSGLSMDLELDSLVPPFARPGQCFGARRIEGRVGPPLTDFTAAFGLRPSGTFAAIDLEAASAALSGGQLSVGDADLEGQALTVGVSGLDLGELLRWANVDGLAGTGILDGRIPLGEDGEHVVLAGGRLVARGPGVIHYQSAKAHELLAQGGAQVELMLKALADFRYTELVLTLAHSAGSDTRIGLSLLGANPTVLDGYPFRINVNLSGNTGSILAALDQSYRLPERLWRRARE